LFINDPLATEQSAAAVRLTIADAPGLSEEKLIVRVLPDPPQIPPREDEQETNVKPCGSSSVSTTDCVLEGPMLVNVIV
jgi:hypothetical protein